MREIIWSNLAESDYENNINYLLEEWSEKEALRFVNSVKNHLEIIASSPYIFPDKNGDGYRSAVIVSQITLYYKIHSNQIRLHRFWNNYKNPANLKF